MMKWQFLNFRMMKLQNLNFLINIQKLSFYRLFFNLEHSTFTTSKTR